MDSRSWLLPRLVTKLKRALSAFFSQMLTHTQIIGGITIKYLSNTQTISDPAIFILHGRQMSSDIFLAKYPDFCQSLVQSNFTLVLFDLRNHGTRLLDEKQNKQSNNENHALDMYVNEYGTMLDLVHLCNVIPIYHNIKIHGIIGYSMGAHITLMSITRFQFPVAVSVVGCGDYKSLMKYRGHELSEKLLELIGRIDPINNTPKFKETKLLMVFGSNDKLVPRDCNLKFEAKLAEIGNLNSRSVEAGHEFSQEMQQITLAWFQNEQGSRRR